jgi:hypothetical protein
MESEDSISIEGYSENEKDIKEDSKYDEERVNVESPAGEPNKSAATLRPPSPESMPSYCPLIDEEVLNLRLFKIEDDLRELLLSEITTLAGSNSGLKIKFERLSQE